MVLRTMGVRCPVWASHRCCSPEPPLPPTNWQDSGLRTPYQSVPSTLATFSAPITNKTPFPRNVHPLFTEGGPLTVPQILHPDCLWVL